MLITYINGFSCNTCPKRLAQFSKYLHLSRLMHAVSLCWKAARNWSQGIFEAGRTEVVKLNAHFFLSSAFIWKLHLQRGLAYFDYSRICKRVLSVMLSLLNGLFYETAAFSILKRWFFLEWRWSKCLQYFKHCVNKV